jgi:TatD DNase family protein
MLLVDTHAHLVDERFDMDRDEVISNAVEAGVERMLTVGLDLASSSAGLNLAAGHPAVEAAIGIHPANADRFEVEGELIRELIETAQPRAVGEIGLDYYRCPVPRAQQLQAFRAQVSWAVEAGLPVVVHDRDAHDDVIAVLSELDARAVLHCFSGGVDLVATATEMGLFISFAGNITYKAATQLRQAAQEVPLDRLLLETDSPFLSPQAWRGRRNEPARVVAVAERLAELRDMTVEDVATATTANAAVVFGWNAG